MNAAADTTAQQASGLIEQVIRNPTSPEALGLLWKVWCVVLLLLLLWKITSDLARGISSRGRAFSRATSSLREKRGGRSPGESEEASPWNPFPEGTQLADRWRQFTEAWTSSVQPGGSIGSVDPEPYFPAIELLGGGAHLRKLEGWPGRFLTLGILGTFTGIAIGLTGLNTQEVKNEQVFQLIGGLQTAFMTSIVGIICSLTYLVLERRAVSRAMAAIDDFLHAARAQLPSEPPEALLGKISRSVLTTADSLQTLENDLAATLSESFGTAITENLVPVVETVQTALEKIADSTAAAQVEGVEKIVEQFMAGMNEQLGTSFDQLGQGIESASEQLGGITESLAQTAAVQRDLLDRNAATAEVLEQQLPYLLRFGEQLDRSSKEFSSVIGHIRELETQFSQAVERLVEAERDSEERVKSTLDRVSELGERIQAASTQQAESQTRMEAAYKEALDSFESRLREGLTDSLKTFDGVLGEILERFSGTLADLREQYGAVDRQTAALRESIGTMAESVSGSLEELGELSSKSHDQFRELTERFSQSTTKGLQDSAAALEAMRDQMAKVSSSSEAFEARAKGLDESIRRLEGHMESLGSRVSEVAEVLASQQKSKRGFLGLGR